MDTILTQNRIIYLCSALFSSEEEQRVVTGILVAVAIELYGIDKIRPIRNQDDFEIGLRQMNGEWVLWYEHKIDNGWTSSIVVPSKMHLLNNN